MRAGQPFPGNDQGQDPSLAWVASGSTLREVHQSPSNTQHWYWDGALNAVEDGHHLDAQGRGRRQDRRPFVRRGQLHVVCGTVAVSTGSSGPFAADVLFVSVDSGAATRIRYPQRLFVEVQPGNTELEQDGLWFFAGDARDSGDRAWASGHRAAGKLVRLWVFNDVKYATTPPPSFAATDTPLASWYDGYCASVGCVKP